MRKRIVLLSLVVLLTLTPLLACGQKEDASARGNVTGQKNTVTNVLEAGVAAAEAPTAAPTQKAVAPKAGKQFGPAGAIPGAGMVPSNRIDVDLASLSSTMVYSEVYAMMEHPEDFLNKVVRMRGVFACSEGREYYFCIIQDATACCAQGIEFVLAGEPAYPNGYPQIGKEFTVTGVFDDYYEGDRVYYHLRDAVLEG